MGRFNRDWTQGSIVKNLLLLSWPMILTNTLMMLGPTIDMIWVGKLGSVAIAAVGISGMAVMMMNSMLMGLAQGMRAVIARFVGAQDYKGANHSAQQAFVICFVISIIMAIIGMFYADGILRLLGLDEDVIAEGAVYMRIIFVGSLSMTFRMLIESIMQASGDTVSPMIQTLIYRVFHVVLCPFLIFGWWIFPEMGLAGAAWTNVISQSLGTGIGLWYLFSGRTRVRMTFKNFSLDFSMMWRIIRIGIPALISGLQRSFIQMILVSFIVPFGTIAVAAHTLNQRIEMILFMPCFALGMAAGVLAGQNLGAGQPERAQKGSWIAVLMVEGLMIVFVIFILLGGEILIKLFTSEPDLVEMSATFLRVATAGYILMGFGAVFMNALQGAGDTVPPMLTSVLVVIVFTLPLAYFLPKITDLGVMGIRWAMAGEMVLQSTILTIYFRTGKWKTRRI